MRDSIHTLVVDDEPGIRFFLQEALNQAGHKVEVATSGEEALNRLQETYFDLVMLDLMLGGRVDGMRVLGSIKWRWPQTAVIILTAHGSLDSALSAIREGVDGYLLKPVEPEELWQTVKDIFARRQKLSDAEDEEEEDEAADGVVQLGPFRLDAHKRLITRDGQLLDLTPSEYDLMAYMMENPWRAIPPKELVYAVRGYECEDLYEARQIIKWYIHRLRQKIEPNPSEPIYVLTSRGVGYRFTTP